MSAGRPLLIDTYQECVFVSLGDGQRLDPRAAEVLMALGGPEPDWLRVVEGLEAVHRLYPRSDHAFQVAADVLGRKPADRARLARTSTEETVLVALAGGGQPQVAANPACIIETWDLLAGHRSETVRAKAGQLGALLPPALAAHPDIAVKARVARNPACPGDVLAQLAAIPADSVQTAVAGNPSTAPETLGRLRLGASAAVAQKLAANARTPLGVLRGLARHADVAVRASVAANPAFPPSAAARLCWDRSGRVRYQLAGRSDLSARALGWVERYARRDGAQQYRLTRWRLAQNPASPPELLDRLGEIEAQLRGERRPLSRREWLAWVVLVLVGCPAAALTVTAAMVGMADGGSDALPLLAALCGLGLAAVMLRVSWRVGWRTFRRPLPRVAPPTPRMLSVRLVVGGFAALAVVGGLSGDMATVLGSLFWGSVLYRFRGERKRKVASR
jgi:hypothetical protein